MDRVTEEPGDAADPGENAMEYTELDDYPIPAGVVTSWTPTTSAEAWEDDPRGLSYDHAAHLARDPDGSWIGSVMKVPLPFDADTLRRALWAWIARHEVLRTTVRKNPDPTSSCAWRRQTVHQSQVDVRPDVRGHLSSDAARTEVTQFLAGLSPIVWPHCVFATVHGEDVDGFMLVFAADHSVMDAYSQVLWFAEMEDLYRRALAGVSDDELAQLDVGSHVDFSAVDRRAGEELSIGHPAVGRWRAFTSLDEDGAPRDVPAFPHHPDVAAADIDPRPARQHSLSTWILGGPETDELGRRLREHGFGLQAGALAALGIASRRGSGIERLRFVMPMHTRHDPHHRESVGWYVGLCPVDLDLSGAHTFDEAIVRADTATREVKDLARHPFPRVAELLGVGDTPHFVMSYVDLRHVPGAEKWPGQQARTLRSPVFAPDELYLWLLRHHGGLNISVRYPGEVDTAVRELVAHLRTVFADMVDHERTSRLATTGGDR